MLFSNWKKYFDKTKTHKKVSKKTCIMNNTDYYKQNKKKCVGLA